MPKFTNSVYLALLCFGISLVVSSCDKLKGHFGSKEAEKAAYRSFIGKSEKYLRQNNDSCLIYGDSALYLTQKHHFGDSALIACYQLRASFYLHTGKFDSAQANVDKIHLAAKKKPDSALIASCYKQTGEIYLKRQNLNPALNNLFMALNIYSRAGMEHDMVLVKINIGKALTFKGDFEGSQKYLMEANRWLDEHGRFENLSPVCISIGNNFAETGSHREAIGYYRRAAHYALDANDNYNAATALNDAGISYRSIDPDSSLYFYRQALAILKGDKTSDLPLIVRYNMANVYYKKHDYRNASAFSDSVLWICRERKISDGIARGYSFKAMLAENAGNIPLAEDYLNNALHISDSIGNMNLKLALMKQLYQVLREHGNLVESSALSDKINILKDSVMNTEKQVAIHRIEQQYQSEKKELENKSLRSALERDEERLVYRHIIILLMVVALLTLSIFLWITHRLSKERSNAYRVLLHRYEVEKQQQSVLGAAVPSIPASEGNTLNADSETAGVMEQIRAYFDREKPFLDPKFKVEQVAENLNIPYKTINSIIRDSEDESFTNLVNRYRVQAAKEMLEDTRYNTYKIEAISNESGFGSKQSFYRAFEQFTGIKPAYYRSYMIESRMKHGAG